MKKLYLLLVMLCVAVASWADVTATFLANSGNQTVTNGKVSSGTTQLMKSMLDKLVIWLQQTFLLCQMPLIRTISTT